jgi:predicted Zn-dependent protease
MLKASQSFARIAVAGLALAAALGGCATGKTWSYDEKKEADGGARQHKGIVAQPGVYSSSDLSDYVAAVGGKLAAVSGRPELKWQFTVLDSPRPDAFATRGGYVYITRGMLALLRSENDLAAVLAHEIAHISTRDALRAETHGNIIGLGTLVAAVAYAPVALLVPQLTFAPAGAGMAAFSRHDELKADEHGAEYLRRAGYPPESMSAVMEIVANIEAYGREHGGSPGNGWHRIFADHPSPDKRQARLGDTASASHAAGDPEFLARLDGLEFGAGKWTGIPAGRRRYFAQWNLALEVPDDWTANMNPDRLWLIRKDGKARMSLERSGTGATGDLCEALAPLAKDASLTGLQRASEGGVQSCTGLARRSTKTIFGKHETVWSLGIVSSHDGARYVYRGFRAKPAENDPVFLSIARSIERLDEGEERPKPTVVRIRRVQEGDSFATLARTARVPDAETALRLLNQRYPSGELVPGQLVKVIE